MSVKHYFFRCIVLVCVIFACFAPSAPAISKGSTSPQLTDNVADPFEPESPDIQPSIGWQPLTSAPGSISVEGRADYDAVWTGTEMIIWSGYGQSGVMTDGYRYNPTTRTWKKMSTVGAPPPRAGYKAVWTGTEMIVWGGSNYNLSITYADGGRYNPATDTWSPMATAGAPSVREGFSVVWTGAVMIVWGGTHRDRWGTYYYKDGAYYYPATNKWTKISTPSSLEERSDHSAVFTGTEMIIWGGKNSINTFYNGGRYNLATNAWNLIPYNGAPGPRSKHIALWTGTRMIIWGGTGTDVRLQSAIEDGGLYNPATGQWTQMSQLSGFAGRYSAAAVWTGTEMVVWGGIGTSIYGDGARYNPTTNTWKAVSTTAAPPARYRIDAVWTGSNMILWFGIHFPDYLSDGGIYNPASDTWSETTTPVYAPAARESFSGVWTGSKALVWGGNSHWNPIQDGASYDMGLRSWEPFSSEGAPAGRSFHSTVWTGSEMIVWGGDTAGGGGDFYNDGGRYDPSTDSWITISALNAPSARRSHTAVWTGTEMIIWGGENTSNVPLGDGARYNPATDTWVPQPVQNAPSARIYHTAVWTGREMIIWGGLNGTTYLNTGARYNPQTNTWTSLPSSGAPSQRYGHASQWSGFEMLIWGGRSTSPAAQGARYNPVTNAWTPMSMVGSPACLVRPGSVWNGGMLIVWGGSDCASFELQGRGGMYYPRGDYWLPIPTLNAPSARVAYTPIWAGDEQNELIVWGGSGNGGSLSSGARIYLPPFVEVYMPLILQE